MSVGVRSFAGWLAGLRTRALVIGVMVASLSGAPASTALPKELHTLDPGAVVLGYSRFGVDDTPAFSIRLDQFEAHLRELQAGELAVISLDELLRRLEAGEPSAAPSVVITMDGAHRSILTEAAPRLSAASLPFTIFVSTDVIDRGGETVLTWDELRALRRQGASFGIMGAAHGQLPGLPLPTIASDIDRAISRFAEEMGEPPQAFAYPYGAYDETVQDLLRQRGIRAAFGIHSGVVHGLSDRLALPRFIMNEEFGGVDRLQMVATALPLPVSDVTPSTPMVAVNPPDIGFTLPEELQDSKGLACFVGGLGRVETHRLGGGRVEVRLTEPLAADRGRLNCTVPTEDGRRRWFGMVFFVPEVELESVIPSEP